jgi:hypothetical protein
MICGLKDARDVYIRKKKQEKWLRPSLALPNMRLYDSKLAEWGGVGWGIRGGCHHS